MSEAPRDQNFVPAALGQSSTNSALTLPFVINSANGRLLTDNAGGGAGTVTSVSVVTANGISGTVATATTTPAITLDISGLNAAKIADGSVSNTEFQYLDGVTSSIQTQLNAKGTGTVTTVSVVSANGLAGTVANATTTPAITLSTTITGILKGDGTAISAATAGTDYVTASSTNTFTNKTYDTAGTGNSFSINGVAVTANTGTGAVARATSPTFVTPTLGAATATTINKVTITAPASGSTLTIADGKTLTVSDTTTLATAAITLGNGKVLTLSDSTTLNTNSITLAGGEVITFSATNALSLLTTGTSVMTFPTATDTVVTLAATQTLTNKRITPRVLSAASYTTNTGSSINGDTQDMFIVTAQTGAIKFMNPTGTPTDGQKLIISVASSTTAARAITWDTAYGATTTALPTTTAATTVTLTIGFIWSASKSLWQCMAVS